MQAVGVDDRTHAAGELWWWGKPSRVNEDLDRYLGPLLAVGEHHSEGFFSLNPSRMREILSGYRLPRAHQFVLKLVQWAVAAGAGSIDLILSPAALKFRHDGRSPTREELAQLLNPTNKKEPDISHLSVGLTAALDFKPASLCVETHNNELLFQGVDLSKPGIRLRSGQSPQISYDALDQVSPGRRWVGLSMQLAPPSGNILARGLRKLTEKGRWIRPLLKELECCCYCPVPLRLICGSSTRRVDQGWRPAASKGIYLIDRKSRPGLWSFPEEIRHCIEYQPRSLTDLCWIGDSLLSPDLWDPLLVEMNRNQVDSLEAYLQGRPSSDPLRPETCLALGWLLEEQLTSWFSLVHHGVLLEDFRVPRLENVSAFRCLAVCNEVSTEISSLKLVQDNNLGQLLITLSTLFAAVQSTSA